MRFHVCLKLALAKEQHGIAEIGGGLLILLLRKLEGAKLCWRVKKHHKINNLSLLIHKLVSGEI